jgi:hypothetical protein
MIVWTINAQALSDGAIIEIDAKKVERIQDGYRVDVPYGTLDQTYVRWYSNGYLYFDRAKTIKRLDKMRLKKIKFLQAKSKSFSKRRSGLSRW